tara:strand:- start:778 stop:1530 length:753 start_codon:yes stop_codon:yes gene_type:complete
MTIDVPLTKASLVLGSLWKLCSNLNGFKSESSYELATQACIGRSFQLLDFSKTKLRNTQTLQRAKVRLLEDDYICWFEISELIHNAFKIESLESEFLTQAQIISRIPKILSWALSAKEIRNEYLWGGTIGPDFDCSGLVQAAFASEDIWIPRDAYQQERFCKNVTSDFESISRKLIPGDLIFFGSAKKCNHVGLHIDNGFYIHSSGVSNGHNGIAIDSLFPSNFGNIASFYRSQFRSAGRVISCYQRGLL